MRKTAHLFTGLLAALVLTACGGNNGQPIAERDTVSVSGEGTIKARPDIFNLVAVARERGDDVAAMKDEVDRQVQAMLDLAKQLQIDDKHITASDIQIAPEWEYQPERKLIGHQVSREVSFRTSGVERGYSTSKIGFVQSVSSSGINNSSPQLDSCAGRSGSRPITRGSVRAWTRSRESSFLSSQSCRLSSTFLTPAVAALRNSALGMLTSAVA